jgi:hypothetical protein
MWNNSQPLHEDDYRESPLFDSKVCDSCDHKALLTKPWGDKDKKLPRCTDAKCWKGKQEAAFKFSRAAEVEKLAKQGITKIFDKLGWDKRANLFDEEGCCKDCDKRGAVPDYDKERDKQNHEEAVKLAQQVDAIFEDDSIPTDRMLEVSIECLLREFRDDDIAALGESLGLSTPPHTDFPALMIDISCQEEPEKLRILARLCFEQFSDESYDKEMDDYMLKRFKGEEEFMEDTDEEEDEGNGGAEGEQGDEVEDSEEDDDE